MPKSPPRGRARTCVTLWGSNRCVKLLLSRAASVWFTPRFLNHFQLITIQHIDAIFHACFPRLLVSHGRLKRSTAGCPVSPRPKSNEKPKARRKPHRFPMTRNVWFILGQTLPRRCEFNNLQSVGLLKGQSLGPAGVEKRCELRQARQRGNTGIIPSSS